MANFTHHSLLAFLAHQPMIWKLHVSKKVDSFSVLHQLNFVRVQSELQLFLQKFLNRCEQFFQLCFVGGDDYKVIGVADVILYMQFALYELIKLIHVHIREQLRGQIADRYTTRMKEIGVAAYEA